MFTASSKCENYTDSVSTDGATTCLSSPQSLCPIISVWSEIVEYCTLSDSRSLFQTFRWLYIEVAPIVESNRQFLRLVVESEAVVEQPRLAEQHRGTAQSPLFRTLLLTRTDTGNLDDLIWLQYEPIMTKWNQLHTLDLSEYATDDVLDVIQPHLPLLENLHMVGSSGVTRSGIMTLSSSRHRQTNLRYLDITLCAGVAYSETVALRRQMHHPELIIRRIPQWMEGHFHTPFPKDGIHTYYADGSFQFEREHYNCGHVCHLFRLHQYDKEQLASQLQFATNPVGSSMHSNNNYRQTLVVRPTPREFDHIQMLQNETDRTVLVGQCLLHEETPQFCLKSEYGAYPIGIAQLLRNNGSRAVDLARPSPSSSSPSSAFLTLALAQGASNMITRMLVTPLEHAMPPPDVVQRIQSSMDDTAAHVPLFRF